MEEKNYTGIIPVQEDGSKINVVSEAETGDIQKAKELFEALQKIKAEGADIDALLEETVALRRRIMAALVSESSHPFWPERRRVWAARADRRLETRPRRSKPSASPFRSCQRGTGTSY